MKEFNNIAKLVLPLSLFAVAISTADRAEAGELVGRVGSSGYRSYTATMTDAQRRVGDPIGYGGNRGASLVESSYHGSNYFSYEIAKRDYQRNLKNYKLYGANYNGSRGKGLHYVEPIGLVAVQPEIGSARQAVYSQDQRVTATHVAQRTTSPARSEIASYKPQVVAAPVVEDVSYGAEKQQANPASQQRLSLLADPERVSPPAADAESKDSIWYHFKSALVGR